MSVNTLVERGLRAAKRDGLLKSAHHATSQLAHHIADHRRILFFSARPRDVRVVEPRLPEDCALQVERVAVSDAETIVNVPESLRPRLLSYLSDDPPGQEMFLAYVGALVGWGIYRAGATQWPITETRTSLSLSRRDAALTAFFVDPSWRGRHLYQTLLSHMARYASETDVSRLWIWCDAENHISRSAIERVGFDRRGEHNRVALLGWSHTSQRVGDALPSDGGRSRYMTPPSGALSSL